MTMFLKDFSLTIKKRGKRFALVGAVLEVENLH